MSEMESASREFHVDGLAEKAHVLGLLDAWGDTGQCPRFGAESIGLLRALVLDGIDRHKAALRQTGTDPFAGSGGSAEDGA